MTSLKMANRRVGSLFAVAALVLATITPGLIPAFASAAQLTERSVQLSSSSKAAEDVTYTVTFSNVLPARVVLLDFCSNTPLIGTDCTAPAGFDVSAATVTGGDFAVDASTASADNTIVLTGTMTADDDIEFTLEGVNNPSAAGPLYVRILTYEGADTAAATAKADAYVDTAIGDVEDQGTAGASITDTIGVSGAVLETLTFCVAGNVINQINCTTTDNGGVLTAPTLKLGEGTGASQALVSTAVSEGSIYSQLSTNASGGAVVNLKSGNTCGGLQRAGATACDIAAALESDIAVGEAKFGVKVAPGSDPATGASGTFQIAGAGTYYSSSVFKLNYLQNASAGVTSVFGDTVLDTADGPVSNKNAQITFGASISNDTPAGLYSNDFSLIATGKY